MKKTKINILLICIGLFIFYFVWGIKIVSQWTAIKANPHVKVEIIERCKADGYKNVNHYQYYYAVQADVKYSAGMWPFVNREIIKTDTLLMLHRCE